MSTLTSKFMEVVNTIIQKRKSLIRSLQFKFWYARKARETMMWVLVWTKIEKSLISPYLCTTSRTKGTCERKMLENIKGVNVRHSTKEKHFLKEESKWTCQ
ncbi:hypothetical protein CR513_01745, partial [Mucuna pruriens]